MIDDLHAFRLAREEFERRLALVTSGDHDRPTPCSDWNVRALIDHVLAGDVFAVRALAGATLVEAIDGLLGEDLVGPDVLADFRSGADAVAAAFAAADPDSAVHHVQGEIPVRDFIEFRTTDYAGHAWDLAVAIDEDRRLDDALVGSLLGRIEQRRDVMADIGHFGRGPTGAHDGSEQGRLLDLIGRSPVS
ncbi:MAG: TIGR03086 family protein [Acidimicrobiales bacterium]|nr:MAG: TIGR03086 family protein [Acidimicrobiales bacterium]